MKVKEMKLELETPKGVEIKVDGDFVIVKGKNGEVKRILKHPTVKIKVEGNKVIFSANKATKREKTIIGSFDAHIRNMFKGVTEKHHYELKICSGHFPMNVGVSGNKFIIKNFLGEKIPREMVIKPGVTVKVEGEIIKVDGIDKELVSQSAASIERLTIIRGRDTRIFQDGCYIINKDGKGID